jgi:nucleotide-binding universal stress UspA family protein
VSHNLTPIVAGIDGSDFAIRAARWTGAVADKFAVPLHLLHAMPYVGHNLSEAAAAIRAAAITQQRDSAEMILKAAQEAVHRDYPDLSVITKSVDEPADEALVAASRQARLIVLGCDDIAPMAALLVGSTTIATTTHSSCPVVAWRGDSLTPTDKPIVVGVDGSAAKADALATAFELADRFGAPLWAVHSWAMRAPVGEVTIPSLIDWDALEALQWAQLKNDVDPWSKQYPDVNVTLFAEPAKPSQALLHRTIDAQLVVTGSRRRNVLSGALLGSTSLNLLHHSRVPVVVCPVSERD